MSGSYIKYHRATKMSKPKAREATTFQKYFSRTAMYSLLLDKPNQLVKNRASLFEKAGIKIGYQIMVDKIEQHGKSSVRGFHFKFT